MVIWTYFNTKLNLGFNLFRQDTAPFEAIVSPLCQVNPIELPSSTRAVSPIGSSLDGVTNHLGSEDEDELDLSGSNHVLSLY